MAFFNIAPNQAIDVEVTARGYEDSVQHVVLDNDTTYFVAANMIKK